MTEMNAAFERAREARDVYWLALSVYQDRRVVDALASADVERLGDIYRVGMRTAMMTRWTYVYDLATSVVRQNQIKQIMANGRYEDTFDGLVAWLDSTCGSSGYGRWTCDIWGWPDLIGIADKMAAAAFVARWM